MHTLALAILHDVIFELIQNFNSENIHDSVFLLLEITQEV